MQTVIGVGISILALLLIAVIRKKQKSIVDYMLMVVIGLFAALLWSHVWISNQLTPLSFVFQNLAHHFLFPSYVLYALLLLDGRRQIRKEWWWVGSFAVLFAVFSILDMTVLTEYDEDSLRRLYVEGTLIYHVFYKTGFVFDLIVLLWLLKRIRQYRQRIKEYYSSIESIHLNWLNNFTLILIIVNAANLITFLLYNVGLLKDIETVFLIVFGTTTAILFYFCYHGVRQYNLAEFRDLNLNDSNSQQEDEQALSGTTNPKYHTSSLKEEEMEEIYQQINHHLAQEKIYLDPDLKVQHLAQQIGVTTHNISQTINSKAEKPFYDLVNSYRVSHLKHLLADPDNQRFTILGLGTESGFNSKSSLNRIFKHHTGMSPGEFRKRQYQETVLPSDH